VKMTEDTRPFRPCAGILLLNRDGKVFVGTRLDLEGDHWQMPQGGIDDGETPRAAALRELEEEIGTAKAEIIAEYENWIDYRLPDELSRRVWKGRYQGQRQRWFALRFLGEDGDIDLDTEHPEFKDWKWADIEDLPELAVPFKRESYAEIRDAFRDIARALVDDAD